MIDFMVCSFVKKCPGPERSANMVFSLLPFEFNESLHHSCAIGAVPMHYRGSTRSIPCTIDDTTVASLTPNANSNSNDSVTSTTDGTREPSVSALGNHSDTSRQDSDEDLESDIDELNLMSAHSKFRTKRYRLLAQSRSKIYAAIAFMLYTEHY